MTTGHHRGSRSFALPHILIACAMAAWVCPSPARATEPREGLNACGCGKDSTGSCYCDRKAKCGCPGECEPKGCEEKQAKQFAKELELETRKAGAAARKEQSTGRGQKDRDPDQVHPDPGEATPSVRRETRLTAAERRTLLRLLDVYVVEHPESRHKTVEDTQAALSATDVH